MNVPIAIFIVACLFAAGIIGVLWYARRFVRPPSSQDNFPIAENLGSPQRAGKMRETEQREPVVIVPLNQYFGRQPTYRVQRTVSWEFDESAVHNVQPPDGEFRM